MRETIKDMADAIISLESQLSKTIETLATERDAWGKRETELMRELSQTKAELETYKSRLNYAENGRDAWKLKFENQLKHCSEADLELHHAKLKAERLAEALERLLLWIGGDKTPPDALDKAEEALSEFKERGNARDPAAYEEGEK